MHISDGVLDNTVVLSTAVLALGGCYAGLKKLDIDDIPKASLLSAAFFVVGLIHFNLGVSSVHLVLNGLMGVMLGWVAFPVIAVSLSLQYLFFGFGGITSLGANIFVMAGSAIVCYALFKRLLFRKVSVVKSLFIKGFIIGVAAIIFNLMLLSLVLLLSGEEYRLAVWTILVGHIPVMVVEGLVTGSILRFSAKASPELFGKFSDNNGVDNSGDKLYEV